MSNRPPIPDSGIFFFLFWMNLLNYTPLLGGAQRTKRDGGKFALGSKLTGEQICLTGKAVVILTGNHGAVSVRDIGDEERDSEMVQV